MSIEQFFTREKANAGIKIPLILPDGKQTEHWLVMRGVDSDAFREAKLEEMRAAAEIAAIANDEERNQAAKEAAIKIVASLVADWSMPEPCTPENVQRLLTNAPQIRDMIDKVASNRALFFTLSSQSSKNSVSNNSGSTKSQKVQPVRREKALNKSGKARAKSQNN